MKAAKFYAVLDTNVLMSAMYTGNTWRTLTKDEWGYLLSSRTDASEKVGYATVCGTKGIIILPDDFEDPKTNESTSSSCENNKFVPESATEWEMNIYPAGDSWNKMEAAGALFLPAAGYRSDSTVNPGSGYYWSATDAEPGTLAYCVKVLPTSVTIVSDQRSNGYSVRLVTECQ